MTKVLCNNCGWHGEEDNLKVSNESVETFSTVNVVFKRFKEPKTQTESQLNALADYYEKLFNQLEREYRLNLFRTRVMGQVMGQVMGTDLQT